MLEGIHTGIRATRSVKVRDPDSISEIYTETESVLVDGLRLVQQWPKDYNKKVVSEFGLTTGQIYQIKLNRTDSISIGDKIYLTEDNIGTRALYTNFELIDGVTKPLDGSIELTVKHINIGQLIGHKQVIAVSSN